MLIHSHRPGQFFHIVTLILLATFTSCLKDEEAPPAYQPEFLIEAVHVLDLSREEVAEMLSQDGFYPPGTGVLIRYGVDAYRLTYNTVLWDGTEIEASGALLIPKTTDKFPLLSFQPGTLGSPSEAPSLFQSLYTDLASVFSSTGFIVALPDYPGYGVSAEIEHPYEHRQSLATATRDMIRAAREFFLVERREALSDQLFLSGYSAGGFATLAALKLLQEDHADEFRVTAATAGGGAYNKTMMFRDIVGADTARPHIGLYLWALDGYNKIYPELRRPYTAYFNEPWATQIAQDGVFSGVENNPSLLLNPSFVEGILTGSDTEFLSVLADNDVYDWRPEIPLKLYHGLIDEVVPFFNAQTAYDAMTARGAADLELDRIGEGTHESSLINYMVGTFGYFFTVRDTGSGK